MFGVLLHGGSFHKMVVLVSFHEMAPILVTVTCHSNCQKVSLQAKSVRIHLCLRHPHLSGQTPVTDRPFGAAGVFSGATLDNWGPTRGEI